jgi:hypothetical protein
MTLSQLEQAARFMDQVAFDFQTAFELTVATARYLELLEELEDDDSPLWELAQEYVKDVGP